MTTNTGFFKTYHDPNRGWILNEYPITIIDGTKIEINGNKYNITPGLQKVLTDRKYKTAKSLNDADKVVFRDILLKTGYYKRLPCLLYTSPSPRDGLLSRMPSSA